MLLIWNSDERRKASARSERNIRKFGIVKQLAMCISPAFNHAFTSRSTLHHLCGCDRRCCCSVLTSTDSFRASDLMHSEFQKIARPSPLGSKFSLFFFFPFASRFRLTSDALIECVSLPLDMRINTTSADKNCSPFVFAVCKLNTVCVWV